MHLRALLLSLALFAAQPLPLMAQDMATLTADRVSVSGDSLLVAEGGVEISYRGQLVRATSIRYDRAADVLTIEGPILIADGQGNLLFADQAELSADLTEGLLKSARLVMNEQLQIAAARIHRVGGRYTQLSNSVASSCQVCSTNPTPLWEIRAARVVHDQQERQLYFDRAQLRMAGVPVFYLPRLRMPDPTLDRATGFLMPRIRTTSGLGTGIKLPYFIALGPSRDLTLTPYLSTKNGRTLELRYRQAFQTGDIQFDGALSRDDLRPGEDRFYGLATGSFDLPRDYKLSFQLEAVSDPAYLLDYGISEKDRIDSRIEVSRTRRNEHISGRLVHFRTIREGESNATLPSLVGDFTFYRRFSGGPLGGEAGLRFQTHSHYRTSDAVLDGVGDADDFSDGRDLGRVSLRLDWRRTGVFGPGLLITGLAEAAGDIYSIRQDAVYQGETTRLSGAAGVELRWPWVAAGGNGATYVIEPIAQLVVSPRHGPDLPNEDSALVEFDEGNLFALNRFSGSDAREEGLRANLGLSWTRFDASGGSVGLTLGRVLRDTDEHQFSAASGLDGLRSDWLAAARITLPQGLAMTNRLIIDDGFGLTKAELRVDLQRQQYGLSSSYLWIQADPGENRLTDSEELVLDGRYDLTPNWEAKASGRFDLEADRATQAGLGLEFRNECLALDLSLSRRFTSSTSVEPTTDFGLSVDLLGFGGGGKAGPARRCR